MGSRLYAICFLVIAGGLWVHVVSAFLVVSWIVGVAMKLLVGHSYSVATKATYICTSKKHAAHSLKLVIVFTCAIRYSSSWRGLSRTRKPLVQVAIDT